MVEASLFIGTVIVAVTQFVKYLVPKVSGPITIIVAAVIGGLIGLVDTHIGVADITVAQGIMVGLSASGTVSLLRNVNGGVK